LSPDNPRETNLRRDAVLSSTVPHQQRRSGSSDGGPVSAVGAAKHKTIIRRATSASAPASLLPTAACRQADTQLSMP